MKRTIATAAITVALTLPTSGWTEEAEHSGHGTHAAGELSAPGNAVKHEMRLLDAAYKNLLDSILLDTPEAIEPPFHEVHRAKMATEKALHAGKVVLPKNGDKLGEFIEMDEAFHGKLKKLIGAARKKDRKGIQDSAHEILDSCVQCHTRFRK
ncbi:MAG: cytochrome c [Proteobacteria bacterium]|nr:cytochrome c [Pseudomonadota bacterium]